MDKKFKNKEELNKFIEDNRTPFSELEKRIDYSILDQQEKPRRIGFNQMWKRLALGFASVVLIIGAIFGGIEIKNYFDNNKKDYPFELGTYVYSYHVGEMDDVYFSDSSTLLITNEVIEGPGSFHIYNNWEVYGNFKNSYFDSKKIEFIKVDNATYEFKTIDNENILFFNCYIKDNEIIIEVDNNNNNVNFYFEKQV